MCIRDRVRAWLVITPHWLTSLYVKTGQVPHWNRNMGERSVDDRVLVDVPVVEVMVVRVMIVEVVVFKVVIIEVMVFEVDVFMAKVQSKMVLVGIHIGALVIMPVVLLPLLVLLQVLLLILEFPNFLLLPCYLLVDFHLPAHELSMTLCVGCRIWSSGVVVYVPVDVDWMRVKLVHVLLCLALHLLLLMLLPILFLLQVLLLFDLPFPLLLLQFIGGVVQLVLVVSEGHMIIVVMVWNDLGSWRLVHGRCAVRMQGLWSSVGYRMHRDWFMHDRVMGVNVLRFGMMGF